MSVLAIYGSTRPNGNAELLADHVLDGIPATKIHLRDYQILPIIDQRHEPGGFAPVEDDLDAVATAMLAHQTLLFVTPLYWYGFSGLMKNFVDRWSQLLRDPRFAFKESMAQKTAYLVVVGGDSARRTALPLVEQFGYVCDFVRMTYGGYLIGEGNRPGDVLADQRALADAGALNQHLRLAVAEAVSLATSREGGGRP